jgi:anthranilate synthase component II
MKILVLDNYDSFTYNLVQYIRELGPHQVEVHRNDAIELDAVAHYDAIVLSPGPGLPADAGIMPALIRRYAPHKPILGVCLGQQAIGEAFGGSLENLSHVFHGVDTPIYVMDAGEPLFHDLPQVFRAGRYHSWVVRREGFPEALQITAEDESGAIMALRHKEYNVRGVQFHPESIMTEHGRQMLANFFHYCVELPVHA